MLRQEETMLRLSRWIMAISVATVLLSLLFVFSLEGRLRIAWMVLGHILVILGAAGFKLGFILRMESMSRQRRRAMVQ